MMGVSRHELFDVAFIYSLCHEFHGQVLTINLAVDDSTAPELREAAKKAE